MVYESTMYRQSIPTNQNTPEITFVIIHFNTLKLLRFCITTLLDCYPNYNLLVVDNGSDDTEYLESMSINNKNISCLFNLTNLTHGPAMHQAMYLCCTDYVFFLDSDCVVRMSGFIEEMVEKKAYAVGDIQLVDINGVNVPSNYEGHIRYVHPSAMLVNRKQYFLLPPFKAHGAPCIDNMRQANKQGLLLVDFPIRDYVVHIGRGTRKGLGVNWTGIKKRKSLWQRIRS